MGGGRADMGGGDVVIWGGRGDMGGEANTTVPAVVHNISNTEPGNAVVGEVCSIHNWERFQQLSIQDRLIRLLAELYDSPYSPRHRLSVFPKSHQ